MSEYEDPLPRTGETRHPAPCPNSAIIAQFAREKLERELPGVVEEIRSNVAEILKILREKGVE